MQTLRIKKKINKSSGTFTFWLERELEKIISDNWSHNRTIGSKQKIREM